MAEFLYYVSFFLAAFAAIATVWQHFTSDGSPPSDRTPDFDAYDDDDNGWGDDADDADD